MAKFIAWFYSIIKCIKKAPRSKAEARFFGGPWWRRVPSSSEKTHKSGFRYMLVATRAMIQGARAAENL